MAFAGIPAEAIQTITFVCFIKRFALANQTTQFYKMKICQQFAS